MSSLILLDTNRPNKNRFKVLQEVGVNPVLQSIPVMIQTDCEQKEFIVHSYAYRVYSHAQKSVKFDCMMTRAKQFPMYCTLESRILGRNQR